MKSLTPHQQEIMWYVAEGYTNEQVGELLHLSTQTVKNTLTLIYKNLGVRNRAHAAVIFTRYGGAHVERAKDV